MSSVSPSTASSTGCAIPAITYPLTEFYARERMPMPMIYPVAAKAVPEPYRSLLVHQSDMTPTLERFYGRMIHLQTLRSRREGDWYFREVLLILDGNERPVEFGAIKINLALFEPAARERILEARLPLGRILQDYAVPHFSRPKAYLCIESDSFIRAALKFSGAPALYGRRNTLIDPQDRPLAEIVEILPPATPDGEPDGRVSAHHRQPPSDHGD
jgi:chorismate-pyruvate lyase